MLSFPQYFILRRFTPSKEQTLKIQRQHVFSPSRAAYSLLEGIGTSSSKVFKTSFLLLCAFMISGVMMAQDFNGAWIVADGQDANGAIFEFQQGRVFSQMPGQDAVDSLTFDTRGLDLYSAVQDGWAADHSVPKNKIGYLEMVNESLLHIHLIPTKDTYRSAVMVLRLLDRD